jgi:opacity protein-like surface antigen
MTLKQSFAGAVASVALMSAAQAADLQPMLKAPAAVEQQATGYVEVFSGWASTRTDETVNTGTRLESESFRINGWVLGGAGRANYWITRDMSVQVDAQAEGTSYELSGRSHFSTHSYLVGGHWSWRSPEQYLFGLFAAGGDAGGLGFFGSERHGLMGAEAQWYWSQFTLYAQGGYDTTSGTIQEIVDNVHTWFARGTGRYFINPNFLIEGTVMYANGRIDFNSGQPTLGFQTWTWGVKAEWRLPTAPFSVFAKYEGSQTKFVGSSDIFEFTSEKATDNRVLLGLKVYMGDRTLQQTDRTGATLDIMSPLANPTSPLRF